MDFLHVLALWWFLLQSKQSAACWEKCYSRNHNVCVLVTDPPDQSYDIRSDEQLPLAVLVERYRCEDEK